MSALRKDEGREEGLERVPEVEFELELEPAERAAFALDVPPAAARSFEPLDGGGGGAILDSIPSISFNQLVDAFPRMFNVPNSAGLS